MVFKEGTGKTGICDDIDFLCTTDDVSYPLIDKARNVNRHYYKVVSDILSSSGRNQHDDSNLATLPKVDLNMVNATHEVALSDANLKIYAVEIKDPNGNYVRINEIDYGDMPNSISTYTNTSGFPSFYDVRGSYIYLEPAPATASVTLTAGLRIWVAREVDVFVSTDTTQEPGFAEPFHRILSLGAAYDFLLVNGPTDKCDRIIQQYEQLRKELREFYSDKNMDIQNRFRPAHSTLNYT